MRDTVRPGIPIMSVNGLIVEGADVLVDDLTLAAGRLRRAYQLVPGAALGGTLAVQTGADGGEGLTAVNARAYYQYNDLGTVLATTDANGARVGLWRPTFFGEYDDTIDYAQGPTAAAGSPVWPEIGLTGKIWDEDTKLYYFNARWYDPHRGRWMSEDPIRQSGGMNLYALNDNDTINRYDNTGLCPSSIDDFPTKEECQYFCEGVQLLCKAFIKTRALKKVCKAAKKSCNDACSIIMQDRGKCTQFANSAKTAMIRDCARSNDYALCLSLVQIKYDAMIKACSEL